jgi:7,8-dihydropterin-6-yl-methyl-4-(beta-D-ribofuranosyl)aminobenzene 5'-phosphate synthase
MPPAEKLESKRGLVKNKIGPDVEVMITIVYDNNGYDGRLTAAWGFSCVVKRQQEGILFDTGGDGRVLLSNMERLGISPDGIDAIVLSHIHGDHAGGIDEFLKRNSRVMVYAPLSFPEQMKRHIKAYGVNLVEVHEPRELFAGIFTTGELGGGVREQSLLVKTSKGLVLITGCAHPGVVNIVKRAKEIAKDNIYIVVGGFHLGGAFPSQVSYAAETLLQLGVEKVALCHCSGDEARKLFEDYFAENYLDCGIGQEIVISLPLTHDMKGR